MTMIPVSKLTDSNKNTILHIDEILKRDVVGQDDAINEIAKAIKRSRAGFSDNNKCTSLMMLGSTGCGKCVTGNTKIRIKNKKTGKILSVTMHELKSIAKNSKGNKNGYILYNLWCNYCYNRACCDLSTFNTK